jgi:outer membrane protein
MKGEKMKKMVMLILGLTLVFNSGVMAEEYDLQKFLSLVKKNSKELKTARKELDMADANKREALSAAFPKLTLDADYNRYLTSNYLYVDLGEGYQKFKINRNNQYGLNVVLSQTLFSLNVRNAIKAAGQYQKLTDFSYDAGYQ